MGAFKRPTWMGGGGDDFAPKAEGKLDDVEQLAVLLACGSEDVVDRLELLTIWNGKRDTVRAAYRIRAKRLLRAWGST